MTVYLVLLMLFAFQVKHFVCDWLYQPPYMWQNKGTWSHLGGILHSGFHAVGTAILLVCFGGMYVPGIATICFLEFLVHYHIDWAKMNINKRMGWGPLTHEQFWILTGFDQFLHQITYIGIVALIAFCS